MLNLYQLEERIEVQMKEAHVPGFALAIVQDLQVVYAKGFGVTAVYGDGRQNGPPVSPGTLFRIGSVTKPLTGTAIMQLVEAGKLDLDCPVKTYVPWLTFSEEGVADDITLRMLMSHTAGLVTDAEHFGPRDPSGLEAFVRDIVPGYSFVAPPGKLWSYSNPGVSIAGYVAEVVSKKPYAELMQELVFDPLQMTRTTFDPTVAMTYPLAQSHDLGEDGTLSVQHRFADNVGHYPAGFALSTVLDLANFAIMQMNEGRFGETQILSPESVAEMQRVQADMYTLDDSGYGLTLGSGDYKGVRRVGHGGGISTFVSTFDMVPEADVAVIAVANRGDEAFKMGEIVDGILDRLLDLPQEKPEPQPIKPDVSLWPRYVGSYVGNWQGLATIREAEDRLVLDLNGEVMPLDALRPDLYFGRKPEDEGNVSVGFVPEDTGPIQYITVDAESCTRLEQDTLPGPDPESWAAYVGQYQAPFDTLTVRIEGESLLLRSKARDKEIRLIHLGNTRFASQYGVFEFEAKDDGSIASVKLGNVVTFERVQPGE